MNLVFLCQVGFLRPVGISYPNQLGEMVRNEIVPRTT